MRARHHWPKRAAEPESDAERTDSVPVVDVDDAAAGGLPTTWPGEAPDGEQADAAFADELLGGPDVIARPRTRASRIRGRTAKIVLGVAAALIVLLAVYLVDLFANYGDVPRGVTVAGVEVGGLPQQKAGAKLRRELGPRLTEPVHIRAGDVRATLDPSEAGLWLNWPATLAQAGNQPLNPITRLMSFFTTREVEVVSIVNEKRLRAAVSTLADERLNHPATEGSIGFEPVNGEPGAVHAFAVEPRHGQRVADIKGAAKKIANNWLRSKAVVLPVKVEQVRATSAGVHTTLRKIVRPMVSAPITIQGKGAEAVLEPITIADSLRFAAREDGRLRVSIDRSALQQKIAPQLRGTEREAESARFEFVDARPTVNKGSMGRSIDWSGTFDSFVKVAKRADNRVLPVAYATVAPEVTTQELADLGIEEVVGKFSMDGLSGVAGHNVTTVARRANGAIVRPGETFRLDEYTGPRTGANGYLPVAARAADSDKQVSGGGIAPFTTALYNAAYLAGMTDAGHTAHHSYRSPYPAARDAVSVSPTGAPVGMAFTNDSPTGVLIRASVSGGTVTVKLWGTKHYRVESKTSDRSDVKPPPIEHHAGEDCEPRDGAPGFTVSNTRVVYDAESGDEVRRKTTTVTYAPRPKVVCHAA